MQQEFEIDVGQKDIGIRDCREMMIAIDRAKLSKKVAFRHDENDEKGGLNENQNSMKAIVDEQVEHFSHVVEMMYARGVMEVQGEVASKRARFRAASEKWHRFLCFLFALQLNVNKRFSSFLVESEQARMARWKRLRNLNVDDCLTRTLGVGNSFREVQRPALKVILQNHNFVVAMMTTSSDKSLLFMLPTLCSLDDVTIVVVSLVALRVDLQARCDQASIKCHQWNPRRLVFGGGIVLVTSESALSSSFQSYLSLLQTIKLLDRIVIDECHIILNDDNSFRKQLQQLGDLVRNGSQMILLIATLSPRDESKLWKRMYFKAKKVHLFRASTVRINVRYVVQLLPCGITMAQEEEQMVQKVLQALQAHPIGKVVVYANSVSKVQRLASCLDCETYFSGTIDKERKFQEFREGRQRVIVATNALGLGVDILDIRLVLHQDLPRTLLNYC